MSNSTNRKRLYKRVHVLPSLLTLGNFSCGFISIVLCLNALFFSTRAQMLEEEGAGMRPAEIAIALNQDTKLTREQIALTTVKGARARTEYLFYWACVAIFLGMVCDMLDGKVARAMGADSAFGRELDSLADVTTFGIAPAVIVNAMFMTAMPATYTWWTQVIIFGVVFATCAALRLARYNIQSGTADKNIFSGLPSPAAAGCVVTAVLLSEGDYAFVDSASSWLMSLGFLGDTPDQAKARLLSFFLLLPGLLMVTNVPFVHVANRYLSGKKSFAILVVALLLAASVWQEPRLMLFLLFNGYLVWGLLNAAAKGLRSNSASRGASAEDEESALEEEDDDEEEE